MDGRPTPLFEEHRRLGGKMVDYAGWALPVQYNGIAEEHLAVRTAAGLFDVSHMGRLLLRGSGAAAFLDYLLPRAMTGLTMGRALYSPMCNDDGGTVDDLLVYPLAADEILLIVNAANTAADLAHIGQVAARWQAMGGESAILENLTDDLAQLALQGPAAVSLLTRLMPLSDTLRPYGFAWLPAERVLLSRSGYTGEDGFEICLPPLKALDLWHQLLALGAVPAGLGARDTLRTEAAMPLYGHELAQEITPLEAGLGRFLNLDKPEPGFIGQKALQAQQSGGLRRHLTGLKAQGRAIPRAGYTVMADGKPIGHITSGTYSPSLSVGIGMALLDGGPRMPGEQVSVLIRERQEPFTLCPIPFIRKKVT